jgi:lysophospholipase L1-like esterase
MNCLNRRSMIAAAIGAGFAGPSLAQVPSGCGEQPKTAPALQPPLLLTDWAWLAKYREDNRKLWASGMKVDAVFMGDSITEGWATAQPDFFKDGIVGRGISAQTTPQMLVRFHSDVVALEPRVVHIMGGTNDIAENTGPILDDDMRNNVMAMCEIAMAHRIRVILGSVPPASKYWWRPEINPTPRALALNEWLRSYARQIGASYADYATAMTAPSGGVLRSLAKDEVHPTAEGYAKMRAIAEIWLK